jgi:hypothetical protein
MVFIHGVYRTLPRQPLPSDFVLEGAIRPCDQRQTLRIRGTAMRIVVLVLFAMVAGPAVAAPRLPSEPTEIAPGQKVLVDDGTCPGGQIKELTGGFPLDRKTGQAKAGNGHTRRCIKR